MAASGAGREELWEGSDASYEKVPQPPVAWEPEEEECAQFQQMLEEQVLAIKLRQVPERLQFLKAGCRTMWRAQRTEHEKTAKDFFSSKWQQKMFRLWAQATRISRFRLRRLGRAVRSWKLVACDSDVRMKVAMQDRIEIEGALAGQVQKLQQQRNASLGVSVAALSLGALLLWRRSRQWKKLLAETEQRVRAQQEQALTETERRLEERVGTAEGELAKTKRQLEDSTRAALVDTERRLEDRVTSEARRWADALTGASRHSEDSTAAKHAQHQEAYDRLGDQQRATQSAVARLHDEVARRFEVLSGLRLRKKGGWFFDGMLTRLPTIDRLSKL